MKFLSSKLHGFVDYAAAIALIVVPFIIFPQDSSPLAIWFSVAAGIALILYSLITDYSASVRRMLPFRLHLLIDLAAGTAFVVAPFLLGFEGIIFGYYIVMGAAVIMVVAVTNNDTLSKVG